MTQLSEQQVIDQITDRLTGRYAAVPVETVTKVVHDKHVQFDGRPIRDFVPLLVERHALAELSKLGE
ncbi:hypothetical protein O6P37_15010 [Mycobacterium sp. CPCC 205372]|uniref:Uncharacterized protein n=1 Tax=Mycobacterium hippophais TaxID=3016340 RepID=A0ABT4PUK0_9MYCO|nr:hypothetical protein [Mycobacterium hippophais]MCZ8380181.1 hypothetical protein [Mycobacterium hippophais]